MRATLCLFIALTFPAIAEPPSEALELQKKRDAKVEEIDSAYHRALAKLMDRYAADGELSKADEVKKMLDGSPADSAESTEDARLKPLIGVWKRDTDGGVWTITDTKGGILNGNEPFTLKYDRENNRVLVVAAKWVNHFTFTADADVVHGRHEVNGKTARFKLLRVQ